MFKYTFRKSHKRLALVLSVQRNAFAYDGGNDYDNRPVLDSIHDYSFWADIDELLYFEAYS
jgi:hypothetical protein